MSRFTAFVSSQDLPAQAGLDEPSLISVPVRLPLNAVAIGRAALFLLLALTVVYGAFASPLWNPDEGRYASSALEMAGWGRGLPSDWLIPHLDTITRLNKPPLIYWLGALALHFFGVSGASVRLVSVLAFVSVCWPARELARRAYGESAAQWAPLVWLSMAFPMVMGHVYNTDMLLAAAMAYALTGFTGLADGKPRWQSWLAALGGVTAALLTKGPVGLAIPAVILLVSAGINRNGRGLSRAALVSMAACCLAAPWYILAEKHHPGFLKTFILQENLGRFSGHQEYHKAQPVWFYIPVLLAGLLPWTPLFPLTRRLPRMATVEANQTRIFLWVWAAFICGFFSLSKTKLISYVLPAFPALVPPVAAVLAHWHTLPSKPRRAVAWAISGMTLLLAVGAGAYLLADRVLPRSAALPWVLALGLLGICSLMLPRLAVRNSFPWAVFGGATVLFLWLSAFSGRVALYEDASAPLAAFASEIGPQDRVVLWDAFQPTTMFYVRRPVEVVKFNNNSGLDDAEWQHSPLFHDEKPGLLAELYRGQNRVWMIRRHGRGEAPPQRWSVAARNNDFWLLTNRATPATYDYTAPKKR